MNKRKCNICECEIEVKREKMGASKYNPKTVATSDEGVFFEYSDNSKVGVWFCNKCWEEVRK